MKQEMETMRVTDEERDLLEQMRNYNRSYPNGYPELLSVIIEKFYAMLRQPYWQQNHRSSPNGDGASTKRKETAMETVIKKQAVVSDMKQRLADINLSVSWMDFANKYFHKSSSWFYHKLNGIDGNGGKGGFNEEELEQLRGSLFDLSNRIRRAAESI